jgi:hypothetical protein
VIKRLAAHRRGSAKSWKSDLSPRKEKPKAAGKYFSRVLFIAAGNDISVRRFKRNARD